MKEVTKNLYIKSEEEKETEDADKTRKIGNKNPYFFSSFTTTIMKQRRKEIMKNVSMEDLKKVGKGTLTVLGGLLTVVQLKNALSGKNTKTREDMMLEVVDKYRVKIEKLLAKKKDLKTFDSYKKQKKQEEINTKIDIKIEKLRADLQYELDLIKKVMG